MNVATFNGRRLDVRGILALLLVPLLVAGAVLAGMWQFDSNVRRVEAAVVNNDVAVEIGGQTVPLGRQLTAALVDTKKEQNFTWVLADDAVAKEGLASGRFAAVVTIPKEFSAAATSYADTSDTRQATIAIETSPNAGIAETALGQAVADAAAQSLNGTLTRGYLDKIYLGFNEMGKQFVTVADGAKQLSDGAAQLSDGVAQASDGTNQLADGLGQAASGGRKLSQGGTQLASGSDQLADGLQTMADQTKNLPSQIQQLADGTSQLSDGTAAYASGVGQYVDGINSLVGPVKDLVAQLPDLSGLMTQIDGLMADLPAQAVAFDDQVQAAIKVIKGYLADAGKLQAAATAVQKQLKGYSTVVSKVASGATTVACPDKLASIEGACEAFAQGVQAGGSAAQDGLGSVDAGQLAKASETLLANTDDIVKALDEISAASSWFRNNAVSLQAQWRTISAAIPDGVSPNEYLLTQLTALEDGGNQLKAGGQQLSTGAAALSSGVAQLNAGIPALTDGIQRSSSGARQLSDGVTTYTSGVTRFADGVSAAHDGAVTLASGMSQLASGSASLADGTKKLSDGLAEGAKAIPSYNDAERASLAKVVASPISTTDLQGLVTPSVSLASLLLVLALWLGSLATYILITPVDPRNAASSSSTLHLALRTLLPGAIIASVQAVLMTVLGGVVLGLEPGTAAAMGTVLLVAGLAFAVVNHALAAWAGVWGRIASGVFLLVTAISAITYAAPGIFGTLRPLSPLSPALDAVRAVITGNTPALDLVVLVGWLILGLGFGVLRIVTSRTVSVKALARASA